jgi:hypothetical protein
LMAATVTPKTTVAAQSCDMRQGAPLMERPDEGSY